MNEEEKKEELVNYTWTDFKDEKHEVKEQTLAEFKEFLHNEKKQIKTVQTTVKGKDYEYTRQKGWQELDVPF